MMISNCSVLSERLFQVFIIAQKRDIVSPRRQIYGGNLFENFAALKLCTLQWNIVMALEEMIEQRCKMEKYRVDENPVGVNKPNTKLRNSNKLWNLWNMKRCKLTSNCSPFIEVSELVVAS